MLRNRRTNCASVYLVAVVFLVCSLTRTEASPLRKTGDGRKEATETASSIREGVIVFGKGTKSLNASVEDDTAYQADSPVLPKGRVDFASKEAAWRRLSPSLLCGSDQMKFRAIGSPSKFISLDQEPPSNCGYNMQRTPFGLVMHVPYDGCNVVQEHGNYELPLRWHGIPVTLRCPKPTDPAATQNPTVFPPLDPQMFPGGILPPFYPPWLMPNPQEPAYTTATPHNPVPAAPPVPPGLMDPSWLYYWNQQYKPQDPATPAPPQDPIVPQMPQGSLPYLYYLNQLMPQNLQDPETAAQNVPQIPPAYFGAYPWLNYVPVTPAPATAEQPKPAYIPFNPYMYYSPYYPFPAGAPATAPPATGHFAWYAHAANMPWWVPRRAPPALGQRTNAASFRPQYFPFSWYHATNAAMPPNKMPHRQAHVNYHSPVEVSSRQQHNLPVHKSK